MNAPETKQTHSDHVREPTGWVWRNPRAPVDLLEWFTAGRDLFPENTMFSGQSVKYFLNRLPVAVVLVDETDLETLKTSFPAGDRENDPNSITNVHHGRGEIKFILDLDGWEFHLMIHDRPWAAGGVYLSLDRLEAAVFGPRETEWRGADEDLADLRQGFLRAVKLSDLDTRDAYRFGALASMTEYRPEPATRARLIEVFDQEAAAALEGRFFQKQFRKLVLGWRPSHGFETLRELGALNSFLPELQAGLGLTQNRYHKHDIYYHSIYACDAAEQDLALRLAALFHDFGKVDTRKEHENGESSFHNHEIVSTRHAENILRRLGFPGALKKRVKFLVRNHMFHYTDSWSDRAVRRFMKRVSMEQLEDLIALRLADRKGSGKRSELPRAIKELIRHIEDLKAEEAELKIRDLAIDGHRLQAMGLRPGPEMGELLRELLESVKAGTLANELEVLEAAARARFPEAFAGSAV